MEELSKEREDRQLANGLLQFRAGIAMRNPTFALSKLPIAIGKPDRHGESIMKLVADLREYLEALTPGEIGRDEVRSVTTALERIPPDFVDEMENIKRDILELANRAARR